MYVCKHVCMCVCVYVCMYGACVCVCVSARLKLFELKSVLCAQKGGRRTMWRSTSKFVRLIGSLGAACAGDMHVCLQHPTPLIPEPRRVCVLRCFTPINIRCLHVCVFGMRLEASSRSKGINEISGDRPEASSKHAEELKK